MIKKTTLMLSLLVLCALQMWGIPAAPWPVVKTQPDGTQINVRINGDEFYSFYTSLDGYTLMQNAQGYWTYAQRNAAGDLEASAVVARDEQQRSSADEAFLSTLSKRMVAKSGLTSAKAARKARAQQAPSQKAYDYSKFRGLVILVQWNDASFGRSDVKDFYQKMVNQEGYTGYTNEDGSTNYYGKFTGSVRDYYRQNSGGKFNPEFDVVGPVTVPYGIDYPNRNNNIGTVLRSALKLVDDQVDFSKYDTNGDGWVDMFYVIFAGVGSNTGEADTHVWPHKSTMSGSYLWLDGTRIGTYACSCELTSQRNNILDGIGTICHEFTHVLGLEDLYDTDYETNGQSHDPGTWEIMSGGGYNNYGRTPAGYSAYDRYSLGFANAKIITAPGTYELNPLVTTGEVLKIGTASSYETILLENRQLTSWDAALPGHGMMAARVDSSSSWVWQGNTVNCNPAHNYYELLRALDTSTGDAATDAFPGTAGVPMIGNFTNPSLKTWDGQDNKLMITDITESADGKITIKVDTDVTRDVEDFESMATTTTKTLKNVAGNFTTWNFTRCNVTAPESGAQGTNAVAMMNPAALYTAQDTYYRTYRASVRVNNVTTADAKFAFYTSTDGGTNWTIMPNLAGSTSSTVPAGSDAVLYWPLDFTGAQGVRYRVNMTAGSKTKAVYLDNFTLYYTQKGQESVKGDVNGDGQVNVLDVTELVNMILNVVTPNTNTADLNGDGIINVLDVTELVNLILAGK